jgi:hypothetical protein
VVGCGIIAVLLEKVFGRSFSKLAVVGSVVGFKPALAEDDY